MIRQRTATVARTTVGSVAMFAAAAASLLGCGSEPLETSPETVLVLGEVKQLESAGELPAALATIRTAMESDLVSVELPLAGGRILESMGFLGDAEQIYLDGSERAPKDARPLIARFRLYLLGGREADAADVLKAARDVDENNPDVLIETARVQVAEGELWSASGTLLAAVRQSPTDPEPFYLLGALEHKREAYGEAEGALGRALDRERQHTGAILELGRLLAGRGRNGEALRVYRSVAEQRNELRPVILHEIVAVLEGYGRVEEAAPIAAQAAALTASEERIARLYGRLWSEPREADLRVELGAELLRVERFEQAAGIYRGWAEFEAEVVAPWLGIAEAALRGGDAGRFREARKKALGLPALAAADIVRLAQLSVEAGDEELAGELERLAAEMAEPVDE